MKIPYIIVGLGKTGMATAQYLAREKQVFAIADTRTEPPFLAEARAAFPSVEVCLGDLDPVFLSRAETLVVSPGLPLDTPALEIARNNGVNIIGDIELFVRVAKAPILAVTGTNGKSTVVSLLAAMCKAANVNAILAGNIGNCVLDELQRPVPQFYILELSSFQLDTTQSLHAVVATVLNVTPDHMDRYPTLEDYVRSKQHIYHNAKTIVFNGDDPLTAPPKGANAISFSEKKPEKNQYGLVQEAGLWYLHCGDERIMAASEMRIAGLHNALNALCALAMAEAVGLPRAALCEALRTFPGLDHRLQWVRTVDKVDWYNDSKGTNVGASQQALLGLGGTRSAKIILIAGGQGKAADFTVLRDPVSRFCRDVILLGEDAPILERALAGTVPLHRVDTLETAVNLAQELAGPNEAVLLSPACASFDMFDNFEHRGRCFQHSVLALQSREHSA